MSYWRAVRLIVWGWMMMMMMMMMMVVVVVQTAHNVPGLYRTECRDRHFWIFIESRFIGPQFHFKVKGGSGGLRAVSGRWAALCGFTVQVDSAGDVTLRVSYLACTVMNQGDAEFRLALWLVSDRLDGEHAEPLLLSCSLETSWSSREIICEENYMQVSVEKPVPSDDREDAESVSGLSAADWSVVFRVPDVRPGSTLMEEKVPLRLVHLLGYNITMTTSRITLRCPYGTTLSYTLQNGGVAVDVVSSAVLYRQRWTLIRVDTTVACSTTQARLDGHGLLWTLPLILPPLVLPPFTHTALKVAVGGRYITTCAAHRRGFRIRENDGTAEIRIPFGAEGGRVKSRVSNGAYWQSYDVDMAVLCEWEDSAWKHTRHRTFRTHTIHQKHQPTIRTSSSEGRLEVSVGSFPWNVLLVNVSLSGEIISQEEARQSGVVVSQVPLGNDSHAYFLQVPLTHPLITQKYLGRRNRSYSLPVIFSFMLSTDGEIFHLPAAAQTRLQDVVLPWLEGECTEVGVRILVHYGNVDSDWAVYVGGRRLNWDLVEVGRYTLNAHEDFLSLEMPLYAPGMSYELLEVRGVWVSVWVSLVQMEVMEEIVFQQRCVFPVTELLVCLPDLQVMVLVDTVSVFPAVTPQHVTLIDPKCVPVETDQTRALFSFRSETCGSTYEDALVIYTNEVRYQPTDSGHSGPHPQYRVPVVCVYPEGGSDGVVINQPQHTQPNLLANALHPRNTDERKINPPLSGG